MINLMKHLNWTTLRFVQFKQSKPKVQVLKVLGKLSNITIERFSSLRFHHTSAPNTDDQ